MNVFIPRAQLPMWLGLASLTDEISAALLSIIRCLIGALTVYESVINSILKSLSGLSRLDQCVAEMVVTVTFM